MATTRIGMGLSWHLIGRAVYANPKVQTAIKHMGRAKAQAAAPSGLPSAKKYPGNPMDEVNGSCMRITPPDILDARTRMAGRSAQMRHAPGRKSLQYSTC
jgi:hypothetical protein